MNHYIEYSNDEYPDNTFISYKNNSVTFSDFYHNVSSKSRILTKLNFSTTSKIGILLSNPIDILELYFSCLQLNIIPIIFPSDITNDELQKIIDYHKISLIITEWVRKHQVVSVKNSDFFYIQELSSNYGGCTDLEFEKKINNLNQIQSMHLTSGSTGFPKLINLSFQNFISSVDQWHKEINFSSLDRYIQCLPLNHIAGLSILIRSQLKGFETILMDKFNSKKMNSEIDNGATLVSLVPSMARRLLDNRAGRAFPKNFKGIIIGGDSCSENLIKELMTYNVPVYKVYGMTETCSGICGFWVNKYPEMLNSVGKPFKGTKIRINDSIINIEGPTITPYNHNNKPTNGLFQTSDLGYFKDRFLFIDGRSDDIVISGGENISLSQIKNILMNHQQIKNVHLITEQDDAYGDKIIAYIVLNDNISVDNILNFCKKYLPENKLPHEIEIVEEII